MSGGATAAGSGLLGGIAGGGIGGAILMIIIGLLTAQFAKG